VPKNTDNINAKVEEHHLMVEEVLGGMDIMISQLERRITNIERTLGIKTVDSKNQINILQERIESINKEHGEGFDLGFNKIKNS